MAGIEYNAGVKIEGLGDGKGLDALLFLNSFMLGLDVFSATNSSPWTAHNFAGDKASVDALWHYVAHAVVITTIACVVAAVIDRSIWPLIGGGIGTGYMYALYKDAVTKGAAEGNTGWGEKTETAEDDNDRWW